MILLEDVKTILVNVNTRISKIKDSCKDNVEKEFEENSFQRIFFEQQIKYNKLKS